MKYVLVDRGDNIVDKTEVSGDLKVAKEFFLARKQHNLRIFPILNGKKNLIIIYKYFF